MATAKKKSTKTTKKPEDKVVKKKAVTKKKAVKKKAAPKKAAAKKKAASKKPAKIHVTLEQRHKMICEAAYYISLNRTYETVDPYKDWLQAEAAIDQICTVHDE